MVVGIFFISTCIHLQQNTKSKNEISFQQIKYCNIYFVYFNALPASYPPPQFQRLQAPRWVMAVLTAYILL